MKLIKMTKIKKKSKNIHYKVKDNLNYPKIDFIEKQLLIKNICI